MPRPKKVDANSNAPAKVNNSQKKTTSSTPKQPTANEMREWYEKNKSTHGITVYDENGNEVPKNVIVAYTDGSKTSQNTIITTIQSVTSGNKLVKRGQREAIKFTGVKIVTDGLVGGETNMMKVRVLQHAINLDYKAGLVEDGKLGSATRKALGSHYVKKGETQNMVTALEILLYLNGFDPNGVEYPGKEAFNNVFKTYKNYEKLLSDHNMENGQAEESMKFISEKYQEYLRNDNF